MAVPAKDATEAKQAMLLGGLAVSAEGGCLGCAARVLLAVLHLFEKEGSLLLVDKGEAGETILNFKAVEKGSVLVISPGVKDLLIPENPSVRRLFCRIVSQGGLGVVSSDKVPATERAEEEEGVGEGKWRTEMSTSFSQYVLPTRSFASTTAPCNPV